MSAATKHTPGPWWIHPATDPRTGEARAGWDLIAENGLRIAYIHMNGPTDGGPTDLSEVLANRLLFEAEPDLLAALRAAVPFVRDIAESDAGDDDSHPHAEDARKALRVARAALAKAEGGAL